MESSSPSTLSNLLNPNNNSPPISSYYLYGVSPSEANTASNGPYNANVVTPSGQASENIPPQFTSEIHHHLLQTQQEVGGGPSSCQQQYQGPEYDYWQANQMHLQQQHQFNNHQQHLLHQQQMEPFVIRNPFEETSRIPQYSEYPPKITNHSLFPSIISQKKAFLLPHQNDIRLQSFLKSLPHAGLYKFPPPMPYPKGIPKANYPIFQQINSPMYPMGQMMPGQLNGLMGRQQHPSQYNSPKFPLPSPQFNQHQQMMAPPNGHFHEQQLMGPPRTPSSQNSTPPVQFRQPTNVAAPSNLTIEPKKMTLKRCENKSTDVGSCESCKLELQFDNKGICCTGLSQGCFKFFHQKCSRLDLDSFNNLIEDSTMEWVCNGCVNKNQGIRFSC
uniref:PHD-type domain-containing protein n=1 Tax=Rhabditophanes sp. KR3021 TaxID=114890 RepID=A0AC35U0Q1_9BILA